MPIRAAALAALLAGLTLTEASSQTVQLSRVMTQKLQVSQGLLASLVTSDWTAMEEQARALEGLTRSLAWGVMSAPEYERHAGAFLGAAEDLIEAAERHDQEAAPLAYVSLTLSCVRCHQAVARSRLAVPAITAAPAALRKQ